MKPCPFCGESVFLAKDKHGWFLSCGTHQFVFVGMDSSELSMEIMENIVKEWEKRVSE